MNYQEYKQEWLLKYKEKHDIKYGTKYTDTSVDVDNMCMQDYIDELQTIINGQRATIEECMKMIKGE